MPEDTGSRGEGRRTPRVQIADQLKGYIVTLQTPMTTLDLCEGGFSMQTPFALAVGSVYRFSFRTERGLPAFLHAQVVHCRPRADQPGHHVSGLRFLDEAEAAGRVMDGATSILSFDQA